MARWIGSGGEVKNTGVKDLTGTSHNERGKTRTENLDDMIHYLEYAKYSGGQAARVDVEQEEYWATLLRHLLMEKFIYNIYPIYEERKIIGVVFHCNCGYESEVRFIHSDFKVGNQDSCEITKRCRCGFTKERENDILEYLGFIIDG